MTAFMLGILFAAGAALALSSMAMTVRRYGPMAMALRKALQSGVEVQEVFIQVTEIAVTREPCVLRPDFTRRAAAPASGSGLRAAA